MRSMDPAPPTDEPLGGLEEVARFHGAMPAGVAVSRHGRMFVSFPKWGDDVPFTVAEIHHGRTVAYPYEAVNRTDPRDLAGTLLSVQSVVVDAADRLWILDTGRPVFAPSLYGGLTLVRSSDPVDIVRVPVPEEIRCVLVHPHLRLDTRVARGVLPREIPMGLYVHQSANLAGFLSGCHAGDLELIRRSFADLVVEPHRAPLIRGFGAVKAGALEAGALGCSISGAGPSVFAWCAGDAVAAAVRDAMVSAFSGAGVESDAFISPVSAPGARIVEAA